jgi:hypothetical protein
MSSGDDLPLELSGLIPKTKDVRLALSRSIHAADILRRLLKVAEAAERAEEELHIGVEEAATKPTGASS